MKRLTFLAAIVAAVAAVPIAHAGHAASAVPDVPSTIAVPDGNKLFLVGHAVGVQIYQCNATVTGYAFKEIDGTVVAGPLTALLAVRRAG